MPPGGTASRGSILKGGVKMARRRIKEDDEHEVIEPVDVDAEGKQEEKRDKEILRTEVKEAKQKYPPFDGDTDNLESAELDKGGRLKKAGAPKFYLRPMKNGYDFMMIYKNARGVQRRLVKPIKTVLQTKSNKENVRMVKGLRDSGLEVLGY
jgi:hypothetical protein